MKRILIQMLAILTLLTSLGAALPASSSVSAKDYINSFTVKVDGVDCATTSGSVFVYPNPKGNGYRVIEANDYAFRYVKLMVFDENGMLIEAGGEIYENSETVTGSPQDVVIVPEGGFLVAFKTGGNAELTKAFNTAMEGAVLYNATMSVIYEMQGSFDGTNLTISYDDPVEPSENAKKFLFIGNSSTYFNGTPIKFKGLATAAGVEIDVDYCTFGSANLGEFADASHARGITLRNMLKAKKYDYVVLQDAAAATYYSSKPAIDVILPLIEENGAEALLYMRYSAASTPTQIIINAKKHYENYTRLAETFGLRVCSSATAFAMACTEVPQVPLYAIDGGHHSKEGSYIIACNWLYSFLGVDPVGNSYTAQIDEDTARQLQEVAKKACVEEFTYPEDEKDVFVSGGTEYANIAKGKKYLVTGQIYAGDWTDNFADGSCMGKLTDGKYATSGSDKNVGCYKNASGHSVTVDLGEIASVRAFKTDMYGNEGWGIKGPEGTKITLSFSPDGKSWSDPVEAVQSKITGDEWKSCVYEYSLDNPVNARYVKLVYTGGGFIWSSEISVYGEFFENDDPQDPALNDSNADQFVEPATKKLAWLYWVIGGLAVGAAVAAAIIISKKKK